MLGVLYIMRIPLRLKGKSYKSVMIPTLLYGLECWVADKIIKQSMSVARMKMLK